MIYYIDYIIMLFLFIIFCVCLYLFLPKKSEKIDLDKLVKSIGYNEDSLSSELCNIYKIFIEAVDKNDVETLKEYGSVSLWSVYIGMLYRAGKRLQTICKDDFMLLDSKIKDIVRAGKEVYVIIDVTYSIYDYVTDVENKVIEGSKNKRKKIKKTLVFYREFSNHLLTNCPSCGKELDDDNNFCDYCHDEVRKFYGNWKINNEHSASFIRRWFKYVSKY